MENGPHSKRYELHRSLAIPGDDREGTDDSDGPRDYTAMGLLMEQARLRRGMTVQAVLEGVKKGLRDNNWYRWTRGDAFPRGDLLLKFARVLGLPLAALDGSVSAKDWFRQEDVFNEFVTEAGGEIDSQDLATLSAIAFHGRRVDKETYKRWLRDLQKLPRSRSR